MRRTPTPASICLSLSLLLAACGPPATPTVLPAETVTLSAPTPAKATVVPADTPAPPTPTPALARPPNTPVPPTPTPTLTPPPSPPTATQISIDGDPADWAGYDVLLSDARGDQQGGGFDIAAVRAFANDKFLYVLVETHVPREDYVQLDLEIEAGARRFVVSFRPEEDSPAYMGEVTTGQFVFIGEVAGSFSAGDQAVELKLPLAVLGDAAGLTLLDVRPMAGECCDAAWYAVDSVNPAPVSRVNQVEPPSAAEEAPPAPRVCAAEIAPPAPFGTLPPAPLQLAQPGYTAEWFVAPGAFNMPQEVLRTPSGDLLVLTVRGHTLSRVSGDGAVALVAEEVYGYLGDVDAQGNVYLHDHPRGRVTRVTPDGTATVVVESEELHSACDSGFGIGPDGNLYLALSRCGPTADLIQITPAGQITRVAQGIEQLQALRTAPDGRFLAASSHAVYELLLADYSLRPLGRMHSSKGVSPGGLAVDDVGNIYLSTGARSYGGEVYRLDPNGRARLLAKIPDNGLSGIEWLPETGEIVGGQLRQGGLVAVAQDGALRQIVPGNGIITPMGMAFSPCGELAVANDDGGMMTLADPAGRVSWFMDYLSFTPPLPFVTFAPDGTLYASEGEPMPDTPKRVAVVEPGEGLRTFVEADMPSGLARRADGALFVSETGAGRITRVNPNGSSSVVAGGLDYPQALALDADGNLYAVTGPASFVPGGWFSTPNGGDTVMRITPEGAITPLARLPGVSALAVGPQGDLFAAAGGSVLRITPGGEALVFADGFKNARGLAFDLAGHLYVSDEELNGIARIGGFPQGTLSGVVADGAGGPITGARVQVLSDTPSVVGQVVMADAEGRFSLPAAPRVYTVMVAAQGYAAVTLTGVEVAAGQETALDIRLER